MSRFFDNLLGCLLHVWASWTRKVERSNGFAVVALPAGMQSFLASTSFSYWIFPPICSDHGFFFSNSSQVLPTSLPTQFHSFTAPPPPDFRKQTGKQQQKSKPNPKQIRIKKEKKITIETLIQPIKTQDQKP